MLLKCDFHCFFYPLELTSSSWYMIQITHSHLRCYLLLFFCFKFDYTKLFMCFRSSTVVWVFFLLLFIPIHIQIVCFRGKRINCFQTVETDCIWGGEGSLHICTRSSTFIWLLTGDIDSTRMHTRSNRVPLILFIFYCAIKWLESCKVLSFGSKSQSSQSMECAHKDQRQMRYVIVIERLFWIET